MSMPRFGCIEFACWFMGSVCLIVGGAVFLFVLLNSRSTNSAQLLLDAEALVLSTVSIGLGVGLLALALLLRQKER